MTIIIIKQLAKCIRLFAQLRFRYLSKSLIGSVALRPISINSLLLIFLFIAWLFPTLILLFLQETILLEAEMPHTTTKNHRTKRVDTRPNAKIRAKTQRQHNDQLKIQDIRVTRKGKEERIERELNVSQSSSLATLSKDEKLLRALKKKLRGINDLIEKSKKGEDLNPLQRAKVDQLDVVLEDMEALLQKTKQRAHLQADGSSEEEEDDEIEGEEEMEEADR